ncbi:MAG: hypothetical protein N2688_14155, partial [Burkholderiaceae bacterium]|nr:hypothetical protein [Burkholderiaceae bacterium]
MRSHQRRHDRKDNKIAESSVTPPAGRLFDRELSQLAFNERVLALAARETVPLAERLRFVCIVSSNLDEFFEIRVAGLMEEMREKGGVGPSSALWPQYLEISRRAHALVERQYALFNTVLMPALARHGIVIRNHAERTPAQRKWVREYFDSEVRPLLSPIGLD